MQLTLGERIAQHRKRLGLTQEALAEKLSITAQAVSKWENGQSCPDITTLPRLADIFGISTDELLGKEPPVTAHEAEVVEEKEGNGLRVKQGNWEFHWDSGKRSAVTFAVWVLLVGISYLLTKWFHWEVSLWRIMWPSFLMVFGFAGLFPRFSVFNFGLFLGGGYFLVHNLGLWQLDIADLAFPICIVLFGLSLLVDALRKPNKPKFSVVRNGGNSSKTKCDCRNIGDRFVCDLSFGENTHCVELPLLSGGEASCNFGELTVDLTTCEAVADNCLIEANAHFAELVLKVPRRFSVQTESSTAFGSVNFIGQPDPVPIGLIRLDANASFGEISVRYI